ncbi:hypothetical protein GCM10010244_83950 [Streptomyces coeruleorubidus]|nr:hypothetical protein GCM10010244_83950 [Streptomyces bellus]
MVYPCRHHAVGRDEAVSESAAVSKKLCALLAVVGTAGIRGTHLVQAARRAPFRVRAAVHGP